MCSASSWGSFISDDTSPDRVDCTSFLVVRRLFDMCWRSWGPREGRRIVFGGAASRPEQFEFLRPLVSARRDRACRRAHPPVLSHRRWANAKLHVLIPEEILGVGTAWWALPAPREAWTASHSKFCFHLVDPLSRRRLVVGSDSVVRSSHVKSRPRCCSAQGRRRPLPRVRLGRRRCVEAGFRFHDPRVHRARGRGRRRGPGSPSSSRLVFSPALAPIAFVS